MPRPKIKPPRDGSPEDRRRWAMKLMRRIDRMGRKPVVVGDGERRWLYRFLAAAAEGAERRPIDLRSALRASGLSYRRLAAAAGVSERMIYYLRSGQRTASQEVTNRIADALGLDRLEAKLAFGGPNVDSIVTQRVKMRERRERGEDDVD